MAKRNCIYNVVVYMGDMSSRDTRIVYTTSKESNADRFLHAYIKEHPECVKAYIERSYGRQSGRNAKRFREDEDL